MTNDQFPMSNDCVPPARYLINVAKQLLHWSFVIGHLTLIILILMGPVEAALDLGEIGVGARPLGMGKAFVGGADDAGAIFLNPAGLSRNDRLNLVSMTGSLLTDVNYVMFGASDLSPVGKIGIGYLNASIGSIPLTSLTGSGSTAAISQSGVTDYNNSILIFSYGSKLSRFLRGKLNNVAIGANLKWFLQGFTGGGTAMQNANGGGMDVDFGTLWDVNPWFSLGMNMQNFLPASLGGKFIWQARGSSPEVVEGIPMVVRTGARINLLGIPFFRRNEVKKLDLLVDYENRNEQNQPSALHLGIEFAPLESFQLRFGIDQKPKATEAGTGIDNNLTGGVGINLGGVTFDYAYHRFGELSENATHFFSIGYQGEDRIVERVRKKAEFQTATIPIPEIVPKPILKKFTDVPENYWARKPIEYLATLNFMEGNLDGTFGPTKEMTRGELAVLLVKAKGFSVGKEVKNKFSDVPDQNPWAPFISLAVERKYMEGFPDGTFQSNKNITRAETAVVLANFSGLYLKPKINERVFPDLQASHWASPAIAAAKEVGFFEYIVDQGFGPDLLLTRAEAAEIISKSPFVKKEIDKLIAGRD